MRLSTIPDRHVERIAALYPEFWQQFEEFRDSRGRGIRDWPQWCYCPLAGSYAIVSGGGSNRVPLDSAHLVGELGAVASWRPTKGVYRFDPDLAAALVTTPLDRELPPGVLERLPEWCVWIDPVAGLPGFFAYLESDANDRHAELRLAIDDDGERLVQIIVHLGRGTLRDGVGAALLEGSANAALALKRAVPSIASEFSGQITATAAPLVSLVLYLCGNDPDFGGRNPPVRPSRQKCALGAESVIEWVVGERAGAAIRASREQS